MSEPQSAVMSLDVAMILRRVFFVISVHLLPEPKRLGGPITATPMLAEAVQHRLESEPQAFRCHALTGEALADIPAPPECDVLLIAPQNWEEVTRWLPRLQRSYRSRPWLLVAELRLVGMFLSLLEGQRWSFVTSGASSATLQEALWALVADPAPRPEKALLALFARGASPPARGRHPVLPTPRELQIGCAVSLGLANRLIAETLLMAESTVKSHLHHLLQKLRLGNREAAGNYIERVLSRSSL